MLRGTPPDQPIDHGTVRDGDGTPRRFTTVAWNPFPERREEQPQPERDRGYLLTITIAFILLIAVAAATMYVSFEAQVRYTEAVKGDSPDMELANHLAAISWDMAALTFALLGLATAMRGQSALRARLGNLACVAASVAMNAAPASLERPETLLVWMGPPLLYAAVSDTVVIEIQNRAMAKRGLSVRHASLWSVIGLLLGGVLGVLAWFLRLVFAPRETTTKFREWYLAEVAYAPGRTVAGDEARAAELRAGSAEEFADRVKSESAAAIEAARKDAAEKEHAANERADAAIAAAVAEQTQRADAAITAERHLREQQQKEHRTELESLKGTLRQSQTRLSDLTRELEQERTKAKKGEQSQTDLTAIRRELDTVQRLRSEALGQVTMHQRETEHLFTQLSGRQQVEYLYDRLERQGDDRHGDPRFLSQIAEEFLGQGVGVESTGTVVRYLREKLSASGPQLAAVANGSNDTMGSAL